MCGHGQFLPAYPTLEPQLAQGWNLKAHACAHTLLQRFLYYFLEDPCLQLGFVSVDLGRMGGRHQSAMHWPLGA